MCSLGSPILPHSYCTMPEPILYTILHPFAFHQFVLKILSGNGLNHGLPENSIPPYIVSGGIIRAKRPTAEISLLAR